jgi:hypothetical protein
MRSYINSLQIWSQSKSVAARRRRKFSIVVYPKLKVNILIGVWPEGQTYFSWSAAGRLFRAGGGQGLLRAPLLQGLDLIIEYISNKHPHVHREYAGEPYMHGLISCRSLDLM